VSSSKCDDFTAGPSEVLVVHPPRHLSVHVVGLQGSLTFAERKAVITACTVAACTGEDLRHVLVELSGVTFMDCAGWGALVIAESVLRRRGGSLMLTGAAGAPRRLIALIHRLEAEQPM
jgi:HptB-dependent secretion and biofilm anti anti-sigma factor